MKKIWVWIEFQNKKPIKSSLETLSAAKNISNDIIAITVANEEEAACLGAFGVKNVLVAGNTALEYGEDLAEKFNSMMEREKPELVFAAADAHGKELLTRLCAKTDGTYLANVTAISVENDQVIYTSPLYGGTVLADYRVEAGNPCFVSIQTGTFPAAVQTKDSSAPVKFYTPVDTAMGCKTELKDVICEVVNVVALEDAAIIVAGGRGMGSSENFKLVEKLAEVLHGSVGGTRPAVEEGWIPKTQQVGQSGKTVAPDLYIACGISGATQHLSGIMNAKKIIAINKDEDAPILKVADIGIVGDAVAVLTALIEKISTNNGL